MVNIVNRFSSREEAEALLVKVIDAHRTIGQKIVTSFSIAASFRRELLLTDNTQLSFTQLLSPETLAKVGLEKSGKYAYKII